MATVETKKLTAEEFYQLPDPKTARNWNSCGEKSSPCLAPGSNTARSNSASGA